MSACVVARLAGCILDRIAVFPLHAYSIYPEDSGSSEVITSRSTSLTTSPALPDLPVLAVLPFSNLSGDPQQDYFADGMVEDIITALARMRWLIVIARSSTFVYKDKAVDIKRVGRELGARYVLEGSVRRSGDRVRITGQLIEAENGRHVWAERFEGGLDDVFELQDRIGDSIVSAIEPSVRRAEIERVRVKPTSNLQAYDLVLRALPGLQPRSSKAERDEALTLLRHALDKDPRYTLAKAMAAFACTLRIVDGHGSAEDAKAGLRYAEEALAERNDDAIVLSYAGSALGSLGYRGLGIALLGFRYDEAERAMEQALGLCPNLLSVQFCAGNIRNILGDGDRALGHFDRVMRISPLDPATGGFIACTGAAHLVAGRYECAVKASRRALQDVPNLALAHVVLLSALRRMGRADDAKLAAQRLLELAPRFTVSRYQRLSPVRDAKFRRRNAEIFRAAGIPR